MPSTRPQSKPSRPRRDLQVGDIVAAQIRGGQVEQPIAEVPAGLDQGGPGLLVAAAVATQTAPALKGADSVFRGAAVQSPLGIGGEWKSSGAEAALEIADGLAALTGCQREVGRNSLSSCSS